MTAVLVHTTSTHATGLLAIARVAAAGRVQADRLRAERARQLMWNQVHETGQLTSDEEGDYCYICRRATDHTGEHTPEQIQAWKDGRL